MRLAPFLLHPTATDCSAVVIPRAARNVLLLTGAVLQIPRRFAPRNDKDKECLSCRDSFPGGEDYSIPSSLASAFHLPSTSSLVFESMTISSGQGREKPSLGHLRVASMPIFEP